MGLHAQAQSPFLILTAVDVFGLLRRRAFSSLNLSVPPPRLSLTAHTSPPASSLHRSAARKITCGAMGLWRWRQLWTLDSDAFPRGTVNKTLLPIYMHSICSRVCASVYAFACVFYLFVYVCSCVYNYLCVCTCVYRCVHVRMCVPLLIYFSVTFVCAFLQQSNAWILSACHLPVDILFSSCVYI